MLLLFVFLIIVGSYCLSTFDKEERYDDGFNVMGLILGIISFSGAFMILDYITS